MGNTTFKRNAVGRIHANAAVLKEEVMEQRPEDQDADREAERAPIARPATVDHDWDVKIQRARDAWEAGRRLRKDQPVSPTSLLEL